MNDIEHTNPDAREPTPDPDLGHPVRTFVLVMVWVSMVLALVQWSGIVAPGLRSATTASGTTVDGREYYAVLLQNRSRLSARIEDEHFVGPGWTDVSVVVQPPGDGISIDIAIGTHDHVVPFRLGGHRTATRWIVVAGRPPCPSAGARAAVEVTVRSASGIHRTHTLPLGEAACLPSASK